MVTIADLQRLGISPRAAQGAVNAGRWQRAARGVYLTHPNPPSDRELVAVAHAFAGSDAVVTGMLVLRQLGMRWLPRYAGVDVLVPPERSGMSSGLVRVRRSKDLGELSTWTRYGGRLASAERAVVHAARVLRELRDVRGVVLGAVSDRWAEPAELRVVLDAGQRNGSGLTRRALLDADRGCASPPEAELVDGLIGCGLPFYVNPELWLDGQLLGTPDIWFVGRGVGGEVESRERHEADEGQVDSTYDRHERFAAPGIHLVHLSVGRIRRDVAAAATHLLTRAACGGGDPDGLMVRPRGPLLR